MHQYGEISGLEPSLSAGALVHSALIFSIIPATARGRAWAIHDGILGVLDLTWNNLRMVSQIGRPAGVNTAPDLPY